MRNKRFLYLKNFPVKCLLACLLFFSFITVAGSGFHATRLAQQTFSNELIYSIKERTAKKTALFGEYFSLAVKAVPGFRKYNLFELDTYNRLQKVKANLYTKRTYTTPIINWLGKIETVSQTAAEEPFPSLAA